METLLPIALVVCAIFFVLGLLGSIFRWAKGLIGTLFSLFGLIAIVLVIIMILNGGKLPF